MTDTEDDIRRLKRDEFNEAATDAGVPDPGSLPNKQAVVEAIETPNPALAPDVKDHGPVERTYKVTGTQGVYDTAPGLTFTATIPPAKEQMLIEGGHITRIEEEGT